ncbi:sensor histidine kinase [Tessaracoccus rhinocerotis]|uniref:histidine kinase n=1 Tax=Tessaracoccus rhinocerotis TaxID=1689449 RepID=A0A553K032_9ACTN|nr:histidine kinase [Tessaracoccus rhinocerotis]TRY18062.1 sensor histidine kinase [Tessaracoccus rhinocerotis]
MMGAGLSSDRRRLLADSLAALAALLVLVVPLPVADSSPATWVAVAWSALMVSSLALRRVAPLFAVAVCALAGVGMVAQLDSPTPAVVVVLVVIYSVARTVSASVSMVLVPVFVAASIAGPLSWLGNVEEGERFVAGSMLVCLCLTLCSMAYLLGRRGKEKARYEQLERELTEERFVTDAQKLRQASELTTERVRNEVARELHDVVAHSLSVIVVQAEGSKALLTKRPEAAAEALDVIACTGRNSIGEMRHIVSLLRGDEGAAFGPSPGLSDIPEMVAKAGDRIELEMPETLPMVPESLGLTAFRIVQESVTNFLKHAGATARATVTVESSPEELRIRVADDGIGGHSGTDGGGSGLRGMRERVNAMSGTFRAGPRTGGGFDVTAILPLPSQLGRGWLR